MKKNLQRDSGEKNWYENALAQGHGVVRAAPHTVEDTDRMIATFLWFLGKGFADTFLVIEYNEMTPSPILEYIRTRIATHPSSIVLTHQGEKHVLDAGALEKSASRNFKSFFRSKRLLKFRGIIARYRAVLYQRPLFWLLYLVEHLTGSLLTIHWRPIRAADFTEPPNRYRHFPPCAIVLQGPLLHERSFTLETVRLYKKIFPYADIIVSTWDTEDPAAVAQLRTEDAVVLQSTPPSIRGAGNANLQIVSSAAGIQEAARRGAHYVLKHRSDQRIYSALALETMRNLVDYFPAGEKSNQKKRIVFGNGGPSFSPYWMGEILFGDVTDLADYYAAPLVKADKSSYLMYLVEVYLPSEFLKRKGWKLDWTIEQGLEVYKQCFIPLDWATLDLYWYKYRRYVSHHQRSYIYSSSTSSLVNFGEWLSILTHAKELDIRPEQRFIVQPIEKEL